MKINVTVDLEDFYNEDDETSINEQIKNDIAYRVKNQIWKDFQEKTLESFSNQITRQIALDKDLRIQETINSFFTEKKIKKAYSGGAMVTCEEYISADLEREYLNSGNRFEALVRDALQKQSTKIVNDLKERYDLLFASQIVTKLNEQGMLKEDIAKLLLGK